MVEYSKLSETERKSLIKKEYVNGTKSFRQIAEEGNTYTNRVRRDAIKFGFEIKSKSETQSLVLQTGRSEHPTAGTQRSDETKDKISSTRAAVWATLSDEEKKAIGENRKAYWDSLSEVQKENALSKAAQGIAVARKHGSKLEKYLMQRLIEAGRQVSFHQEHMLAYQRLQLDLFLRFDNIAIEVDGPSHSKPIWGDKSFSRNQRADNLKNALLIGLGITVIRVKYSGNSSRNKNRQIGDAVIKLVDGILDGSVKNVDKYHELSFD